MAKSDDGEFELVLGNRQLVSVFLIVVILLGVFFSMGYIVGRNSSPAIMADSSRGSQTSKPIVVDGGSRPATSQEVVTAGSANTAPPYTDPTPAAQSLKPSPAPPVERAKSEPKPDPPPAKEETKREPRVANPEPVAPSSEEPRPGYSYLQVVATSRPDAEIVSESLAKRGFQTVITPGPNGGIFRVLVGPLKDQATLAETRTKLEAAGFKPYARKY